MIDAAQHAAAAGDYDAAERLLRDAVATQEATLGSSHPDLATTLNNLAFVCERTGKVDEAERGYRRAHAIAVASLSPGHPFIKTSLSNLVEFCEARGIPLWTPPETPTEDEPLPDDGDVAPSAIDVESPAIDVAPEVGAHARREPSRRQPAAASNDGCCGCRCRRDRRDGVCATRARTKRHPSTHRAASHGIRCSASASGPGDTNTHSSTCAGVDRDVPAASRAGECRCLGHRAQGAAMQWPREDRLARLAVRARERRTPAGDVYVLHAAADHFRDEGRTSVVPRRPRASDDAAARERESRQRLSDVQRDDGQPGAGWRVESRATAADGTVLDEKSFLVR